MLLAKSNKNARCLIAKCKQAPQQPSFYAGYFLCAEHRLRLTTEAFIACLDRLSQSKSPGRYQTFVRDIRKSMLSERGRQCSLCTDIKCIEDFKIREATLRRKEWLHSNNICRMCYFQYRNEARRNRSLNAFNQLQVERLKALLKLSALNVVEFSTLLGFSPYYIIKVLVLDCPVTENLLDAINVLEQQDTFSYALKSQAPQPRPKPQYNPAAEYISPEQLDRMGLKISYSGFGPMLRDREVRRKSA